MSGVGELRALTAARGLAAWAVVLYHVRLSVAGVPPAVIDVIAKGYLAVDFFFLLSGFVIWMAWGPRLHDGGWAQVPAFLRKRVARIWPLHIVVLAGGVLLALALLVTGRPNEELFPFDLLPLHVVLIQNWGLADRLTWNLPSWSISTELFAYLLFVPLALGIDLRRVPSRVLIATLAALLLGFHAFLSARGIVRLGDAIPQLGLLRCVVGFVGGTILGALWTRWRTQPRRPLIAATIIVAATIAGYAAGWIGETLAAPVAFAAILLVLAFTAGRARHPLEGRVLHYLGEISFATYLGHYLLWVAFKLVFVTDASAVPLPLIALYLAMVLASSVVLYHLVERPAQRAINDWRPAARFASRGRPAV